ncbi:MAG TPA: FAD-dependent oxidoreductase [Solirubrobacteraceae bacterium]|nr:FAD-dependent oxidoreductase [Solirubrobacteraceae bacterium]
MGEPSCARIARALSDAAPVPFWLDDAASPAPRAPLERDQTTDLAIVGAGLTGLWTALLAKRADPQRDVVLVDGDRIAGGASGRNGGFCDPTLTHGLLNGIDRFPGEIATLERLATQNFDEYRSDIAREGIECDWEDTSELVVATEPWQLAVLDEDVAEHVRFGHRSTRLDAEETRRRVASPTYLGGALSTPIGLVNPARLAWGLADACERLGVRIHEESRVLRIAPASGAVELRTARGALRARRAALATNAYAPLLRRIRWRMLPVYDYVLVTERLSEAQRHAIGWNGREGLSDAANQFHYYRLTADERILWGGYDAVYYRGNGVGERYEQRPATFALLARHFHETFPQLEDVRFSHRWGGAIDVCSRFSVFWGRALKRRVAYCAGFTGAGVVASRFGARVLLALLGGEESELTRLRMVRRKPLPFPPEPLRSAVVARTRASLASADEHEGERDVWLKVLDRFGLGFDS